MEKYDYEAVLADDIKTAFDDYMDYHELSEWNDLDDFKEEFRDHCFNDDGITGNASGSYFFNSWEAEEAICHNLDLYQEALEEFGYSDVELNRLDAETMDVTIRCYLVGKVLEDIIEELPGIEEHFINPEEEEEEEDEEESNEDEE